MPIELRHLRAFHAVATELNFRRASERLNIAQPALSRTIKDLEHMLSVTLLQRTTRVVGLTEAGSWFQRETRGLLDQVDQAIHRARRVQMGVAGALRIGFNDPAINGLLPEIIRVFRAAAPEIDVILVDESTPTMIDLILDRELDIAFHHGPYSHPQLDRIIIRNERLIAVLPVSHPLVAKETISITDLSKEPFVLGRLQTWRVFHRVVRDFCLRHGFDFLLGQQAEHSDGIMALVAANIGITLHYDAEWIHSRPGIVVRRLKEPAPRIVTQASWRRDRGGPAMEQFLSATAAVVKEKGLTFDPPAGK
ncbi:LysR substrate-binding domain-containing protein [Mesorhizobium sp. M0830]|uniref:LysR family transcriptional regulator n=1 Tax=Mesorhizobium sp. M0830 TaxID=2957008 RepID=UPI00333A6CAC